MVVRDDDNDDVTKYAASTDDATADDLAINCKQTTPHRKDHLSQVYTAFAKLRAYTISTCICKAQSYKLYDLFLRASK